MRHLLQSINRTRIIIAILFLAVVVVVIVGLSPQPQKGPIATPTPLPTFTNEITNPSAQVSYKFSLPPNDQFPPNLTTYTPTYPDQTSVVLQITQTFGLGEPTHIIDRDFEKYMWVGNDQEINYYPKTHSLIYQNYAILNEPTLSENDALKQALLFLQGKFNFPQNIQLAPLRTRFINSNGTVGSQVKLSKDANLTEVEFTYNLNGSPLHLPPYSDPAILLRINERGVRQLKMKLLPGFSPTGEKTQIIALQAAAELLVSGQGTILKVDDTQLRDGGTLFDINQMVVTSAAAGYVVAEGRVVPAAILTGQAPNRTDNNVFYQVVVGIPAAINP